eukprot:2155790-Rhodomonas_salina.3
MDADAIASRWLQGAGELEAERRSSPRAASAEVGNGSATIAVEGGCTKFKPCSASSCSERAPKTEEPSCAW